MQSKREIIGESLYNFFEKNGIDPALGLAIFITIVIIHRGYSRFFKTEDDKYSSLDKINDVILVLVALLIYYLYLF